MSTDTSLGELRRRLRAARAALPPRARRAAALRVAHHLRRLPAVRNARRIAAYWAVRGELDLRPAIDDALRRGSAVYLPVVRGARLCFRRYRAGDPLPAGRYGIPAPATRGGRAGPGALQVVLAPLVAFDESGNRVGSGGGYYDRALARRGPPRRARGPFVVGIAYEFQRVARLAPRAHDVALDAVVTPAGARVFGDRRRS